MWVLPTPVVYIIGCVTLEVPISTVTAMILKHTCYIQIYGSWEGQFNLILQLTSYKGNFTQFCNSHPTRYYTLQYSVLYNLTAGCGMSFRIEWNYPSQLPYLSQDHFCSIFIIIALLFALLNVVPFSYNHQYSCQSVSQQLDFNTVLVLGAPTAWDKEN